MAHSHIKTSTSEKIFQVINYIVFGLFTLICVYPFYYIFINTISNNRLSDLGLIMFYPKDIHFENYKMVFELPHFGNALIISVSRTILGTIGFVFCTTFFAYIMTKREMWGHKFWYRFLILTMYFSAGMIPGYILMQTLGLIDTYLVYIIPSLVGVYSMILIKTYIEQMPASMEESAEIDGAGYWTCFTRIVFPLAKPIVATITIFHAVNQWNAWMDTLIYISDPKLYSLQFILQMYLRQSQVLANMVKSGMSQNLEEMAHAVTATSARYTVTMVVVLPILFVYPFFQKYFTQGIMLGAVKG